MLLAASPSGSCTLPPRAELEDSRILNTYIVSTDTDRHPPPSSLGRQTGHAVHAEPRSRFGTETSNRRLYSFYFEADKYNINAFNTMLTRQPRAESLFTHTRYTP